MAQQTIDIGSSANDGTGDPIRDAFDKCNDNFSELYAGLTGLLDFKGSTDCSATPNYPAAGKGDYYLVSVAGKIGGTSGVAVQAGDSFFALADNAGGSQASVGSSWTVVQGNLIVDNDTTLAGDSTSAIPTQHAVKSYVDSAVGGGGGGGASVLDDLTDVDTTSTPPSTGDVLTYDGSEWVPDAPTAGSGGGSLEYIGSYSPSAVASLNIENFAGLSGYSGIRIVIEKILCSADGIGLNMRFKLNGSYKTSADYKYTALGIFSSTTASNRGSAGATSVELALSAGAGSGGPSSSATKGISGFIDIFNPYDTAGWKRARHEITYLDDSATWRVVEYLGSSAYGGTDATSALAGIQLLSSSGTFSGTVHVYGVKNS